MAGLTHCSFRRLVADFGGCGGFFTEMLAPQQVLREDFLTSPYLRRNSGEERLIYQLMFREKDPVARVIEHLATMTPDGIDINLACHAPLIRRLDAGSGLFENAPALKTVLRETRACWPGLLTVKIRLGRNAPGWEEIFADRLQLFEDEGVDAVFLHTRFFEDKYKRAARPERLAWAVSRTRLPMVVNGDITGPDAARKYSDDYAPAAGLMIGRAAVERPWIFAEWRRPQSVHPPEVWRRMLAYIREDFAPETALSRIKLFTEYHAVHYHFGHTLYTRVRNAPDLDAVSKQAEQFFKTLPAGG
jgi:tRNA-dihydrouridine synthase